MVLFCQWSPHMMQYRSKSSVAVEHILNFNANNTNATISELFCIAKFTLTLVLGFVLWMVFFSVAIHLLLLFNRSLSLSLSFCLCFSVCVSRAIIWFFVPKFYARKRGLLENDSDHFLWKSSEWNWFSSQWMAWHVFVGRARKKRNKKVDIHLLTHIHKQEQHTHTHNRNPLIHVYTRPYTNWEK